MNFRSILVLFLFATTCKFSLAQGYVEVVIDPAVQAMEEARIEKNIKNGPFIKGYRIMVAFYPSRAAANEKLAEVRGQFEGKYGVSLLYDEPNFKIYVGEFTSKTDADAALMEIKKKYPGARVVKELVTIKNSH